jgi:FtsP/CotA-like multicopper oxidase with cupredoxin domain
MGRLGGRFRFAVAGVATAAVVGPLAWFWQASLLPDRYPVTAMGYADYGGGPPDAMAAMDHGGAHHTLPRRSVTSLVADPRRPADVAVTLIARKQGFRLPSGRRFDGYTLNGQSPGPVIAATVGQLVEVRLVNESVPDGVTLHWHGVEVPAGEDGVAGVTQDAVRVGGAFTYRFVANRAGTFWYHSHQTSHHQVAGGLLGAFVVKPAQPPADVVDTVALVHLYGGIRTVNGLEGAVPVAVPAGGRALVRVVNSDNGPTSVWVAGAAYRLAAVDGTDVNAPTPVRDTAVLVTAGGRADLDVTTPADGSPVRVQFGGSASVVLGTGTGTAPSTAQPKATIDPLGYGSPAPLGFDPDAPNRRFTYDIGRRPGFLDGRPGLWWTINGHLYPDIPMFVVAEGDVVRMRVANHSGEVHPMHLHGHRAVVLSRNGVRATGSPWWVDSLNVDNGESYDIAFLADNPGIWVDHCHNLQHATQGLAAHLMYTGITTPFTVGGAAGNRPE